MRHLNAAMARLGYADRNRVSLLGKSERGAEHARADAAAHFAYRARKVAALLEAMPRHAIRMNGGSTAQ